MSDRPFDMPDRTRPFAERAGWLVKRLGAELELAPYQAAGIVGNLAYESGGLKIMQEIRPAVPGSRGGWGWAQWTGPRRRSFEAWAASEGLPFASDEANFGFLMVELRGAYKRVVEKLRMTQLIDAAVFVFGHDFEAPGGTTETHLPGFAGRLAYAKLAIESAGAAPPVVVRVDQIDAAIRALQAALVEGGFYRVNTAPQVDGDFGPASRAALDAYYRSRT